MSDSKTINSRCLVALLGDLQPSLIAQARRMMGSHVEAQDVVQDALLIAYSQLDRLRDINRFAAWIRAIVTSQCHRQLRRRGVLYNEDIGRLEYIAAERFDPASAYERKELLNSAVKAISQLSTPLQETCRLYFEADLSVSEIAALLEIRKATVRKRIHGARTVLARKVAEEVGEPSLLVGYLPISDHLLGMVAHRLSAGGNLRIYMKRFLSWDSLARALRQGHINTAFIMAPLAMQLCNSGTQLKYFMDGHHDGSGFTTSTLNGRGRSQDRFQNTLVGVPGQYSTHKVLLGKLTREYPENWNKINTVNTNPSYVINSLKKQIIDAFFCSEPWSTKCVSEGGADIQIRSKEISPGHVCCIIVVRDDFYRSCPEQVSDYVRILYKARDRLYSDVDYCANVQADYTGVSSDLAAKILEEKVVTFDELRPDRERIHEFMQQAISSRVLSSSCDLNKFVCDDFCY